MKHDEKISSRHAHYASRQIKCEFDPETECQFRDSTIQEFDEKFWCEFHMPLQSRDGKKFSFKKFMNIKEIKRFNESAIESVERNRKASTHYLDDVGFYGVEFPGDINFSDQHFSYPFLAAKAVFHGNAIFSGAVFSNFVNFSEATFKKYASFQNTDFQSAYFELSHFEDFVSFLDSHFNGFVNFQQAEFGQESRFLDCAFGTDLNFSRSIFRGKANFAWTHPRTFSRNELSQSNEIGTPTNEENLHVPLPKNDLICANFHRSQFFSGVDFENRNFKTSCSFDDAIFYQAPIFYGATLHEGMTFPAESFFHDISGRKAASAYAKLKRSMEDLRRYGDEAKFYALEQKSLRNDPEVATSTKIASWFYEELSDYGRSFIRPLFWWVLFIPILFPVLIYPIAQLQGDNVQSGIQPALFSFSISQAATPFSVWNLKNSATTDSDLLNLFGSNGVEYAKAFAVCESTISLTLLALFLLALRRRFKMG